MDTPDISTAKNIWRANLSGYGHSSSGYSGPYRTAVTQDGHIVADFIDTGILNANIIRAGIMQSTNGEFSFNLESGHIEASDINITGGDINLDGGTLSILNNDGYKADLSGGVLDLYQGAGTGTGTGYKYLSFGSSMLFKTALGGDWYATIAAPEFTLGGQSAKGFRFGTSKNNASAVRPAVNSLDLNWLSDYMLIEADRTRVRKCVETNEYGHNQFAGHIHHRLIGGYDHTVALGVGAPGGKASAALELTNVDAKTILARIDVYQPATDRVALRLQRNDGKAALLYMNDNGLYAQFGSNKAKLLAGKDA